MAMRKSYIRFCILLTVAVATGLGQLASPAASAAPTPPDSLSSYIAAGPASVDEANSTRPPLNLPDGTRSISTATVGYGPQQTRFIPAFVYSALHPNAAPAGSNNYRCAPKPGQRPIVLVHGTWESAYDNFAMISPSLAAAGYCVFTFNYGTTTIQNGGGVISLIPGANGTGDIATSARQLAAFVDQVRTATRAPKVDIVGHSQGGVTARQYLRFDGGASKVDKLITLGATNHGTTLLGIGALGRTINNLGADILSAARLPVGVSGIQQTVGSRFITELNAAGDTEPGITYTVIRTLYDEVTTPSQSTFLTAGPGARVTNITLQDNCPADTSDHVSMNYSPRAISLIKRALDPSTPLVCTPNEFVVG